MPVAEAPGQRPPPAAVLRDAPDRVHDAIPAALRTAQGSTLVLTQWRSRRRSVLPDQSVDEEQEHRAEYSGDEQRQLRGNTRRACDETAIEGFGKAFSINTDVESGHVLMSGFVHGDRERAQAGEIATGIAGIEQVHNFVVATR